MKRDEKLQFGIIPTNLIFNSDLNDTEKLMMVSLLDRENGLMAEGKPFSSYQKWLADNLGWSVRKIQRAVKSLSDKKYIIITQGSRDGHSVNFYQINWDKINNLGREEPELYDEKVIKQTISNENDSCWIIMNGDRRLFVEVPKESIIQKPKEKDDEGLDQSVVKRMFIKNNVVDFKVINNSKYLKYPEKGILGCLLMTVAHSKSDNYLDIPYDYIKKKQMYDMSVTNEILKNLVKDKAVQINGNKFKINYINLAVKIKAIDNEKIINSMFL